MRHTPSSSALLELLAELIERDADCARDGRLAALHRWKVRALESADAMIPMQAMSETKADAPSFQSSIDAFLGGMIEMRRTEVENWFQQTFGLPAERADRKRRS